MITPEGFERASAQVAALRGRLGDFPEVAEEEMGRGRTLALLLLQGAAADYPPQVAGSGYRRTGTLGRLWTAALPEVRMTGSVLEGRIGNAVPYGPLVQGPEDQMAIHKAHGWRTTEDVVKGNLAAIDGLMEEAGGRMVERLAK